MSSGSKISPYALPTGLVGLSLFKVSSQVEEWLIGAASSPVDVWTTPRSQRQPHLVFGAGQLALRTGWEKMPFAESALPG